MSCCEGNYQYFNDPNTKYKWLSGNDTEGLWWEAIAITPLSCKCSKSDFHRVVVENGVEYGVVSISKKYCESERDMFSQIEEFKTKNLTYSL